MLDRCVVPGTRAVEVISAQRGTIGEKILYTIASSSRSGARIQRKFGEWNNGVCKGAVYFTGSNVTHEFPVVLKLDTHEGLILCEIEAKKATLKNQIEDTRDKYILKIGKDLVESRIGDIANQIVGCWVMHGFYWENCRGEICNWPYGNDERRPVRPSFKLCDGKNERFTLGQLIGYGGVRSTHPGQWNRPYTLIPALCGMKILIHEFKQTGEDVCVFHDRPVSEDVPIWSPYCRWSDRNLGDNVDVWLQDLANVAVSPFAFHLHATKKLFPNCTLNSTYLLSQLGESKLLSTIERILNEEPERTYRAIDRNGVTHKLARVTSAELIFNDGVICFSREEAAQNILQTFLELHRVEDDCTFDLPRMTRLVLDTHFYVVVSGIAESSNSKVAYHLSGSEMYDYLINGDDARMHIVRNERLFRLVRKGFGLEEFEFHIFPPIPAPNGETQYTVNPRDFDTKEWRARVLV